MFDDIEVEEWGRYLILLGLALVILFLNRVGIGNEILISKNNCFKRGREKEEKKWRYHKLKCSHV